MRYLFSSSNLPLTAFVSPHRPEQVHVPFSQPQEDEDSTESRKRGRSEVDEPSVLSEGSTTTAAPVESRRQRRIKPRDKSFICTVHGRIELHPTLWKIIDTPQVCRVPQKCIRICLVYYFMFDELALVDGSVPEASTMQAARAC